MKSKLVRRNIYVKKSSIHHYGVFAGEDIEPGEIIEECCVIPRKSYDAEFMNFYFKPSEEEGYVLALGYGSLYNHSKHPNADFEFDTLNSLMLIVSKRFIKKNEEIFIFYSENWFNERQMKEIEPFRYRIRSYSSLFYFLLRFAIAVGLLFGLIMLLKR